MLTKQIGFMSVVCGPWIKFVFQRWNRPNY